MLERRPVMLLMAETWGAGVLEVFLTGLVAGVLAMGIAVVLAGDREFRAAQRRGRRAARRARDGARRRSR